MYVDQATLKWLPFRVFATNTFWFLPRLRLHEQVLFRPITVMVPDLVLICENMLMAEGFVQAKTLASKFHGLYSLLQELLSKQVGFKHALGAHAPRHVALQTVSPSKFEQCV